MNAKTKKMDLFSTARRWGFIVTVLFLTLITGNRPALSNDLPVYFSKDDISYYTGQQDVMSSVDWKEISAFSLTDLSNGNAFWIRVALPDEAFIEPAVYLYAYVEQFEAYIGNQKVYTCDYRDTSGHPSSGLFPGHVIPLAPSYRDHFMLIRIDYSSPVYIGEIVPVAMGSSSALFQTMREDQDAASKRAVREMCLGVLLLVFGAGSLLVFLIRLKSRDYSFLSFGILSASVGVKYLTATHLAYVFHLAPLTRHHIENISFLIVPIGLFAFIDHISGAGKWKVIRRLWQFHLVLTALFIFSNLILMTHMNQPSTVFTLSVLLTNCLICLIFMGLSKQVHGTKLNRSLLIFVGFFCLILTSELLKQFHLVPGTWDLFGWGLLALVSVFGYALLEQYTKTNKKMQDVSLELERNKFQLLELEQERLKSQMEALKNQINPHFLFNNFSTLASIIDESKEAAIDYVQELSSVYRYVLRSEVQELVPLSDEMEFVRSYEYLLAKRFGGMFSIKLAIPEPYHNYLIPPFSLQLLVENSVKHNIISSKTPLCVDIFFENDYVVVKNTIHKKAVSGDSTRVGLNNIIKRYGHLTEKKVDVIADEKWFTVRIPLLTP
jgi:Histidine kinase